MFKKIITSLLILSILISFITGCGGKNKFADDKGASDASNSSNTQSQDEKIEIEIWNCDGSPTFQEPLEVAADLYMKNNSNITVKVVGLPYDQQQQKFDIAVATNTTPDAGYQEYFNILSYVNQGALASFNPYFDNWGKKNEFDPGRTDQEMYIIDGERYYFPIEYASPVVFYNKNILDSAGLSPAETWDDWFNIVKQTTDPSANRYGTSYAATNSSISFFEAFLLAYTGVDSYFDEHGVCFMRSPGALEGATRWFDAYKNKQVVESSIAGDLITEKEN